MARYFVRCVECLTVAAIDGERPAMSYSRLVASCGACGGAGSVELMGQVERDRLVEKHLQCACDERCTSARGPHCDCKCGGENHGAGLLAVIEVTTDKGAVPVLRCGSSIRARYQAEEFRRGVADALAVLDGLQARKNRGEFLSRPEFERYRAVGAALVKARAGRVHASRMKALAPYVVTRVRVDELPNPLRDEVSPEQARAILAELHAVTSATPPPLAEVPFSLGAPVATASGWQDRLF